MGPPTDIPTGLVYDERVLLHRDVKIYEAGICQIEIPERMTKIYDKLVEYGLFLYLSIFVYLYRYLSVSAHFNLF